MAKVNYSPGPWMIHQRTPRNPYSSPQPEIRAGEATIADIRWNGHNDKHGQANARLIAAAPELLEALEGLMWRFKDADEDTHSTGDIEPDIQAAREVLAKVKGVETGSL